MAKELNQLETIGNIFKDNYIFIEGIGFYVWNEKVWEKISDNNFKRCVLGEVKKLLPSDEVTSYLIDSIAKLCQLELFVAYDNINKDSTRKIVFQNGTYMIKEGLLQLNRFYKEDYTTKIMNTSFKSGDTTVWENYLSTTFKGNEKCIDLVQEMMGYVLYPECNFEKAFILHGNGANGKSVLLNIMQRIVGDHNTSYISMKDLEKSFLRSNLLGKSLNISSELEKSVGKTENFKKLVSGESVEAQFKYKDSFHFKNKAKMLFAMNQLSFIADLSDGLFRRLAIIPFNNQFKKEDRDIHLFDKLEVEIDAITFWAIKGLQRILFKQAFTEVACVEDMTEELKENNNPMLRFFDDTVEFEEGELTPKMELYTEYKIWCSDNGNKAMNSNNFYKQVNRDYKLTTKKVTINGKRQNVFVGIKIANTNITGF